MDSFGDLWGKVLLNIFIFFLRFSIFTNILASQQTPPHPNSILLKNTKRQKIPSQAYERQEFSLFSVKTGKLETNRQLYSLTFGKKKKKDCFAP